MKFNRTRNGLYELPHYYQAEVRIERNAKGTWDVTLRQGGYTQPWVNLGTGYTTLITAKTAATHGYRYWVGG
jgi:hypothetical protein